MSNCDSDDDDVPKLSIESLTALKEFYSQQIDNSERGQLTGESLTTNTVLQENWQLSQFWYDDRTARVLAKEAVRICGDNGKVALISCPTLYRWIKHESKTCQVLLLEFDDRFACYGADFMKYDYNTPLDLPSDLAASFDLVIVDPPFLSQECLTKSLQTVKLLAKDKVILCTGAVMEQLAKTIANLDRSRFQPKHRNNLANEFSCFTNYNMDSYLNLQ